MKTQHIIVDFSLRLYVFAREKSRKGAKTQRPALSRAVSIFRFLAFGFMLSAVAGCSDDFLEYPQKYPTRRSDVALYFTPSTGYYEHTVTIPGLGNRAYSVGMCPKWLTFKYLKGNFANDVAVLKFTVQNVPASFAPGTYESELSLTVEDFGVFKIPVYFTNE